MQPTLERWIRVDRAEVNFALRTTLAAAVALVAATALGLENPYWAAMTVWIVAQPTRGLMWERGFYRICGTAVGAVFGFELLHFIHSPLPVVLLLAIWMGFWAGVGNLMRHPASYAALLAGFTAAIVVLPGFLHAGPPHDLAFARMSCIVLGVLVSFALTALLTPRSARGELLQRMREISREVVGWVALVIGGSAPEKVAPLEQRLAMEMAEIEGLADQIAAGSATAKKQMRHLRGLIAALLALMSSARLTAMRLLREEPPDANGGKWREYLVGWLTSIAQELDTLQPDDERLERLSKSPDRALPADSFLKEPLEELLITLKSATAAYQGMSGHATGTPAARLMAHVDWKAARIAAARTSLIVLTTGAVWLLTGWSYGLLVLVGICIFSTFFSAMEHPVLALKTVLKGVVAGAAAGAFYRLVLLPHAHDMRTVVLTILPFLFIGGVAMARRSTAKAAIDANLIFLLIAQPALPVHSTPAQVIGGAMAMVASVLLAMAGFRFVFPVDPRRRMRALVADIVHSLEQLATAPAAPSPQKWQERMLPRVLRLVTKSGAADDQRLAYVDGALGALSLGKCILRIHDAQKSTDFPDHFKAVTRDALTALGCLSANPPGTAAHLRSTATRLKTIADESEKPAASFTRTAHAAIQDAADLLLRNAEFFQQVKSDGA